MLLTIFTPTYNRAHLLQRTFESLMRQSVKDFEWLIVDDGSTDETEDVIETFETKAEFPIRYVKKENGGKHTAYNVAIKEAKGEFFFTVDSDDWLPDNSLEILFKDLSTINNDESIIGIIALKQFPDKHIIGNQFVKSRNITTFRELNQTGQGGERSIIFRTKIIRDCPYPVITGEKFIGESVVYDKFYDCKMLSVNEILTTCEYQEGGLSQSPRKTILKNPGGYKLYFMQRIDIANNFFERLSYIIKYNLFRKLYKGREVPDYNGKHNIFVILLNVFTPVVVSYYTSIANK